MNVARVLTVAGLFVRRNHALVGMAGVFLILALLIWFPTPCREKFWLAVDRWYSDRIVIMDRFDRLSANQNEKPRVIVEINSPDVRGLLAQASGVPEWRFEHLATSLDARGTYKWNANVPAGLGRFIKLYLSARDEGHTESYAREVLVDSSKTPTGETAFLGALRAKTGGFGCDVIPESRVRQVEYETIRGVRRVSGFVVVDGELAWSHELSYTPDGTVSRESRRCCDAIEFAPEHADLMREAERVVEARLKAESISGLGSCHTYWDYMKEFLAGRGHSWRSPSELNPGVSYD